MTTDNPEVDSPNLEGAGGNQPPVSQGQGKSIEGTPQSSQEVLELKKLIEQQGKELRGLQSRQDKEKTETQRFLDDIKAQVAKGKSIDEAEQIVNASREADKEKDLLRKIAQKLGLDESSPNAAGTSATATDEVAKVFTKYEVDMNDPAAVGFLGLKGAELVDAVASYRLNKLKQPPLDSSAAGSIQAGPSGQPSGEKLIGEYTKAIQEARGKGPGYGNAIKDKYRALGVPVDDITFKI